MHCTRLFYRRTYREIVDNLLENGAPANNKDTQGYAPLRLAAEVGDAEMVRSLLRSGMTRRRWIRKGARLSI